MDDIPLCTPVAMQKSSLSSASIVESVTRSCGGRTREINEENVVDGGKGGEVRGEGGKVRGER